MSTDAPAHIAKAVLEADDRRREAVAVDDMAALEDVLTEDFTYIHNTGFREGRQPYIDRFNAGGAKITRIDRLSAHVRMAGEGVALVDGEADMFYRMPATAPEASFRSLYLAVWILKDGAWRLSGYASTLKSGS